MPLWRIFNIQLLWNWLKLQMPASGNASEEQTCGELKLYVPHAWYSSIAVLTTPRDRTASYGQPKFSAEMQFSDTPSSFSKLQAFPNSKHSMLTSLSRRATSLVESYAAFFSPMSGGQLSIWVGCRLCSFASSQLGLWVVQLERASSWALEYFWSFLRYATWSLRGRLAIPSWQKPPRAGCDIRPSSSEDLSIISLEFSVTQWRLAWYPLSVSLLNGYPSSGNPNSATNTTLF